MTAARYFFCGIGGSGMMPLAVILHERGFDISGSDRSFDAGRSSAKQDYLRAMGVALFPQNASGLEKNMTLVVSSAIEDTIPEVAKAKAQNIPILRRAELLSSLFNTAGISIGVAGTSGKSTVTGMIGYVLQQAERNPTVMNGAVFKNFATPDHPYTTALAGEPDIFVTEIDESDGSIALYNPSIAVLTNISFDHKTLAELELLFENFLSRADKRIVNLDNGPAAKLAARHEGRATTFSLRDRKADFHVSDIEPHREGIHALVNGRYSLNLQVPGRYNLSNALAAIAALNEAGVDPEKSCRILGGFQGVKRRLEQVGRRGGITVIDDFAHNPDKIEASLSTLREFPGRLLVVFQMHGFGPLKLMHRELASAFAAGLGEQDRLYMPEVLYLGGTAERDFTAKDFVTLLKEHDVEARWFPTRSDIPAALKQDARQGDSIIVMGARDDTLSEFAAQILMEF